MADASDSKSDGGDIVWVRLPPSAVETLEIEPKWALLKKCIIIQRF